MTFDIGLHELCVRTGVRYVITKFSGMDSLPNFLTHGAPLQWKWIYNLSRLQQTKSPYQNQRNAFIVSLAVADFCVGLSVIPSLFFCDITNTCDWLQHLLSWSSWVNIIRWLLSNKSVVKLCVLVLDRFIAIVHPLKYITFRLAVELSELLSSLGLYQLVFTR